MKDEHADFYERYKTDKWRIVPSLAVGKYFLQVFYKGRFEATNHEPLSLNECNDLQKQLIMGIFPFAPSMSQREILKGMGYIDGEDLK